MSNGGADFLSLDLDAVPARSKADHLATTLRDAVLSGVLSAGTRLPATRALAADLNVSRGVVVEAYQRLADEGLTAARPRTGTVIAHAAMNPTGSPTTLDARETEPAYDLSPGLPDLSLFPSAAWLHDDRSPHPRAAGIAVIRLALYAANTVQPGPTTEKPLVAGRTWSDPVTQPYGARPAPRTGREHRAPRSQPSSFRALSASPSAVHRALPVA